MRRQAKKEKISYRQLLFNYQLFKDLMDNVPDVIYFKDRKGRLVMVNRAHARGMGLEAEKVVGLTDFDIFSRKRAAVMFKDDQYVMATGKPIIDKVERSTRADGVDNYVSTTKVPRYDAGGKVIGLMGITRDVTHRMQLESLRQESDRIREKLDSLSDMDKMKSEFLGVVSRQLSGPIATIKKQIRKLSEEGRRRCIAGQQKAVWAALNSAQRMEKIIDELIEMTRIEKGDIRLNYALVDLTALIKETVAYYQAQTRQKGLSLNIHLPKDEVNILLDPERIAQVLSSLLDNAVRFTEAEGKIEIELKILADTAQIGVFDTGIGIPKSQLGRLFERFVQVKTPEGGKNKGIGLGLSIIKELVNKHGGQIWAESVPGVGSKFYFTLPNIYSCGVLSKTTQKRINHLLQRCDKSCLINFSVLDQKELARRSRPHAGSLLAELDKAVSETLKEFHRRIHKTYEIFYAGSGQHHIFLPGALRRDSFVLCGLLKETVQKWFIRHGIDDGFISVSVMDPDLSSDRQISVKNVPCISIERMRAGLEKRYFPRRVCHQDQQIALDGRSGSAVIMDISEGGLCFASVRHPEIDANLRVRLKLSDNGTFLPAIAGRVVWVGDAGVPFAKYKIGLEFIHLSHENREIISGLIKKI